MLSLPWSSGGGGDVLVGLEDPGGVVLVVRYVFHWDPHVAFQFDFELSLKYIGCHCESVQVEDELGLGDERESEQGVEGEVVDESDL